MNQYVNLAKNAVENYLKNKKVIDLPKNLPENFYNKEAGVFITIYQNSNLRGCIGTFLPVEENIGKEIIRNAIAAATQDYRFNPITKDYLPELT